MSNISVELNKNIEEAIKIIDQQKKEIKAKKDEKVRAETRIEENEKGLKNDYDEVELLGFEPEKIKEELASFDTTLEKYNQEILEYIAILTA